MFTLVDENQSWYLDEMKISDNSALILIQLTKKMLFSRVTKCMVKCLPCYQKVHTNCLLCIWHTRDTKRIEVANRAFKIYNLVMRIIRK